MEALFLAKLNNASSHPMDLLVYWWRYRDLFEAEIDLISTFGEAIDVSFPLYVPVLFFFLDTTLKNMITTNNGSVGKERYLAEAICQLLVPSTNSFSVLNGRDNWQRKLSIFCLLFLVHICLTSQIFCCLRSESCHPASLCRPFCFPSATTL